MKNITPPKKPGKKLKLSQDENLNTLLHSVVDEVTVYAEQLGGQIKKLSDIGRALSGVHDLNTLLEMIVDQARSFTKADAGTLYIMEENTLRFQIVQNDSLKIRMGGKTGDTIPFPPVELKESNVSAYVAIKGEPVNIPDVYDTDLFDFTGPKKFDQSTGYRSKSMLVIPLKNHENDVIGVLQLLNATNAINKEVIPFSKDYVNLSESLASQAAVAITNAKLISNMAELFEAFVKVMATAIDEKSPVTGGHIRRVANLTLTMAEFINEHEDGIFKEKKFSPDQMYELRIAAYMHDIGKVTTPVEIVEKAKKLQTIFDRIHYVRLRMDYIIQKVQLEGQKIKIDLLERNTPKSEVEKFETDLNNKIQELKDIRSFINKCNEPGEFLEDETLDRLKEISQRTYLDNEGIEQPFLTEDELLNLSIRRGSITEAERKKMQDHAAVTLRMLKQIPFTKKLKNIPNFAGAHHEFINGNGYPLGLKGDQIPFEGRLMAVTDIAEALTASDRPYKKAMPLETVYRILRSMSEKGELDNDLVELFIGKEIYKIYQEKHENGNKTTKTNEK
ncbi:MAG: HD domain-containing phosphohydrolase [Nitrospinota bacterium]|nr:HD domain-containing phosphohydrolase [Nitrospinota bacterium]